MLEASLLKRVLAHVERRVGPYPAAHDELLADLRTAFSGVHFSLCADDDVPARVSPAAANALCRLYYVDSGAHCLQLTDDAVAASGLLVGWLDEED